MTPLEFLSQLWQEKPEDHHILIPVDEVARFEFFQEISGIATLMRVANSPVSGSCPPEQKIQSTRPVRSTF